MSKHRPWTYIKLTKLVAPDLGKECHSIARETVGGFTNEYVGEAATEHDAKLMVRAVNTHKEMLLMLKDLLPRISERDAIRDEVEDLITKAEGKAND